MVATDEIERAAIDRLGVADACVNRYEVRPGRRESEFDAAGAGVWFMLFVRRLAGSPWEAVGRRRTRDELAAMVNTRNTFRPAAVAL
jgi:hypothetical protein